VIFTRILTLFGLDEEELHTTLLGLFGLDQLFVVRSLLLSLEQEEGSGSRLSGCWWLCGGEDPGTAAAIRKGPLPPSPIHQNLKLLKLDSYHG
jgi:hypothetical protein